MHAAKHILLLLTALLLLAGCTRKKTATNRWTVTLDKEDKQPYGTYLAYKSLPYYFPGASVEDLSPKFRYTSMDNNMFWQGDSASLMVLTGLNYYLSDEEWTRLKSFVREGNELFIISSNIDQKIATELKFNKYGSSEEVPLQAQHDGSSSLNALQLAGDSTTMYGYRGRSIDGYFSLDGATPDTTSGQDTSSLFTAEVVTETDADIEFIGPEILGVHQKNGPDFIRYQLGMGHITLHAAPLALSNYFLLQAGNRKYLDGIWHSFPAHISRIYWNEYFKRTTQASDMSVLMRYPATRWALLLAIATLLIYVLFGLKRKQRIIPVIAPVENASVSFVETIGRLYYNKGDHANLAEKMIQHFLEWVRSHYYLDTTQLNDTFTQQLIRKSGKSEEEVTSLIQQIHSIRLQEANVTPAYLYDLHRRFQSFYNYKN